MRRRAYVGGLADVAALMSGRMSTAIQRYPTGRYGIVGSIPYELTKEQTHGTPQIPPARTSQVWETEQEVIAALLAIGVTRFQLADCSWYQPAGRCPQCGGPHYGTRDQKCKHL